MTSSVCSEGQRVFGIETLSSQLSLRRPRRSMGRSYTTISFTWLRHMPSILPRISLSWMGTSALRSTLLSSFLDINGWIVSIPMNVSTRP